VAERGGCVRVIADTRLVQALALLDDARTLLVELVDERPSTASLRDYTSLDTARQAINTAIPEIQAVMPIEYTPEDIA
jgi:hypothetical protein